MYFGVQLMHIIFGKPEFCCVKDWILTCKQIGSDGLIA
jgi:hypothetical protein